MSFANPARGRSNLSAVTASLNQRPQTVRRFHLGKHEIGRNPTASLWRHCFNRVLTADGPEKVPLDDAVDEYRKLDDGARPKIALVI
jgi:hypothetical protein